MSKFPHDIPSWNFNSVPGLKISKFPYNQHFFSTWDENLILDGRKFLIYFLKIKMLTSQACFKLSYDILNILIKCLREFKSLKNCFWILLLNKYSTFCWLQPSLFSFVFCCASGLAFLLSLNFIEFHLLEAIIFQPGFKYFRPGLKFFMQLHVFFPTQYTDLKLQPRMNENFHIISPLAKLCFSDYDSLSLVEPLSNIIKDYSIQRRTLLNSIKDDFSRVIWNSSI